MALQLSQGQGMRCEALRAPPRPLMLWAELWLWDVSCCFLETGNFHHECLCPVMHRELGVLCLCARGDEEEELANAAKEFTPKL